MTSSTVVDAPFENPGPEPGSARRWRRLGAGARRLVLFLALGAVVLSLGLVAGTGDAADRGRTFSETALAEARDNARNLAAEALALAGGAENPLAVEFREQAEGLRTQAALLTDTGHGQRSNEPSGSPGNRTGTGGPGTLSTPAAADPRTPEKYVQALTASADANLRAAWRADPGTARLLAAAGAAQQVWAARAGAQADPAAPGAAGVAGPGGNSPVPADSGNDDAGPAAGRKAPKCPDTGASAGAQSEASFGARPVETTETPVPGPSENGTAAVGAGAAVADEAAPDAAAALKAAIDAEFGAAYAYQVALAQDPPEAALREQWRQRITEHQSRGTDAVGYLSDLCLPAVAPVAAYRLDAGFLRDPAAGLPALEQRLPAVYADLVALSEGSLRSWAIDRLAAVTGELYLQADTVPAAPGLDAVPDDLPWN
ncbi:DUF4439 domain-containing protein [Arthrobacter zhaoxinii]|uniref:DUF4439 domain-containing protein n=1 Tax=Arthrobacter zhaoxinii TaxID=2964616 RepID=UPI002104E5A8|nr:DUF4439 domain-containing protein [Arthrobacter zhaoxinii]MCQ2001913.1 ferritin-like domain-containing protein [Arthrobacter zhaoxinii]